MRLLLLAAGLGLAAPAQPAPPVISRFRIDLVSETTADFTALGGGTQNGTARFSAWITIALSDSAAGQRMAVTVDSMRSADAAGPARALLDSARGGQFTGFVERSGKVRNLAVRKGNPAVQQLYATLASFFPVRRPGARPGDTWVDTLDVTSQEQGGTSRQRVVSRYRATAPAGGPPGTALRIESDFTSTSTATQAGQAGPVSVDGTGTGQATWQLAADGSYLAGTSRHDQSLVARGAAPQPIPLRTGTTVTVSRLR